MDQFSTPICQQLRDVALALPETSEGTSCVNRAFRVRKKNFLFIGEKQSSVRIMVKLTSSLEAAQALADPRVVVGKHGWVTINFAVDDALDIELLTTWARESFRALAPKAVVKQLDG